MTSTLPRPAAATAPSGPSGLSLAIDLPRGLISLRGELDRAHVHRLDDAVDVLRGSTAEQWSIDAAEMTFCDASGLRSLLRAHEVAVRSGRRLVVTRPSRMLTRLLALADVEQCPFGRFRQPSHLGGDQPQ